LLSMALAGSRNLIRPSLPGFSTHKRAIRVSFVFLVQISSGTTTISRPNVLSSPGRKRHRITSKRREQTRKNQPFIQGTRILQPSVQTNTKMSTFNSTCSSPLQAGPPALERVGEQEESTTLVTNQHNILSVSPQQQPTAGAKHTKTRRAGELTGNQKKGVANERVISTYRRLYHSKHKPTSSGRP